jgi:hypothetical protein
MKNAPKTCELLLVPRSRTHPDTLSPGTLHSQNIARLWLHGRARRNGLSSRYSETPFPSLVPPAFILIHHSEAEIIFSPEVTEKSGNCQIREAHLFDQRDSAPCPYQCIDVSPSSGMRRIPFRLRYFSNSIRRSLGFVPGRIRMVFDGQVPCVEINWTSCIMSISQIC